MGFLDNSGDIILDAVLTDTGRKRLARGDGSFKVAKFALGDDEINYGLYDKAHASGSAYYDVEILQTPVLEAFTNNGSSMKSKLITISRTNLMFLSVIKLNAREIAKPATAKVRNTTSGSFHLITVDDATQTQAGPGIDALPGTINGYEPDSDIKITFDQGLDTTKKTWMLTLDPDLYETQYIIKMDNRLGSLHTGTASKDYSFLDDDNIATYYVTSNTDSGMVTAISATGASESNKSTIQGPRGTRLAFTIKASTELESSTFLFEQIGLSGGAAGVVYGDSTTNYWAIDTIITVQGATTGYSVELPVRYIKKA